jgi:hypothetical protein
LCLRKCCAYAPAMGATAGVPVIYRFSVFLALLCVTACGGSDSPKRGSYAEECMVSMDCAEGLLCINRLCTINCTEDAQCLAYSSSGKCAGSVCADLCMDRNDCPNGLQCTMSASFAATCTAQ